MKGNAVLHYIRVVFGLDKPETQTTPREREALHRFASGAKTAIEIGVFEGVNTVIISQSMGSNGKTIGIDPFFKGRLGVCYHERIARLHLRRNKVHKDVQLIVKLSFEAVNDIQQQADFIFIDGDHSYDGIRKDWEVFPDKLKPGGVMALHDTTTIPADGGYVQDSVRYYNDVIRHDNRFEWLETVDRMNVLRKK
ncbi:class I SAM-dependent methyltransferase [Puia sp.]|jgi:predicted O-methyltransferase YrrM|uniref:class I SAM-dependent methyltransferase n=1 Tax=Puia sp. TaxID=2045100 RepID=UPI002F42CD0C